MREHAAAPSVPVRSTARPGAETLYKPPTLTIRVDGEAKADRFVAGTAGQPHLMSPARRSDYQSVFRAPSIHVLDDPRALKRGRESGGACASPDSFD